MRVLLAAVIIDPNQKHLEPPSLPEGTNCGPSIHRNATRHEKEWNFLFDFILISLNLTSKKVIFDSALEMFKIYLEQVGYVNLFHISHKI